MPFKVLLFSRKDNNYTVLDHNLTVSEAKGSVEDLRSEGLSAFHMEQKNSHLSFDAESCGQCAREISSLCKSL